jgi:hypothetical protein
MRLAMDPTSRAGSARVAVRRAVLCIWALACVAELGCAHFERYQGDEPPPMLGAEPGPDPTAGALASGEAPPTAADTYAAWLQRRTPELHGEAVAGGAEPDGATRSTAPPYRLAEPPPAQIALQPPVPLAAPADPGTTPPPDARQATEGGFVSLPPPSGPPTEAGRTGDDLQQIRRIVEESRQKVATLDNYQVLMSRQENVKGSVQPAEEVQLSLRRDPKAVRLEWLDGPNKGREVIYNHGGLMHVNMPGTLVPRISLPPDSPIALKNSRHPISEAGFSNILEQILIPLEAAERGGNGSEQFRYGGLVAPEPGAPACHEIVRMTATGETWTVHIDDRSRLPYMVHAEDASGTLLEHYVFRDPRTNLVELAAAEAFDHESRWGQAGGLFQRLARGDDESPDTPATSSVR